MAKMIQKDLGLSIKDFVYEIKPRSGIAVIGGDSSSGKTLYYKIKHEICKLKGEDKYLFINHDTEDRLEKVFNGEIKDKIVIIDNADAIIPNDDHIRALLEESENQYLIFGRDVGRYCYNLDDYANMVEREKGHFTMKYLLKEKGELWQ